MVTAAAARLSPIALLALWTIAVPVHLGDADNRSTSAECLALSSQDQRGGASFVETAQYERCAALDPHDVELLADLGARYEAAGDVRRAEVTYRRALSVDPGFADVHMRLGSLLLRDGDRAGAEAEADAALRTRPHDIAALSLIQRAREMAGAVQ